MHPGHPGRGGIGRVRVVDDEGEAFRPRRRAAPGKGERDVLAFASVNVLFLIQNLIHNL